MSEPTSKTELMTQINEGWAALTAAATAVDEATREAPGPDGWSVKDQIAHISAWERSLLALLTGESRAAAVGMDPAVYASADVDQMNAVIQARSHGQSFAEVLADAEATHARLLGVLDRLTWEDLGKPYTHYQPDSTPAEDNPVLGWVLGNTIEHYPEHQSYLEAAVAAIDSGE